MKHNIKEHSYIVEGRLDGRPIFNYIIRTILFDDDAKHKAFNLFESTHLCVLLSFDDIDYVTIRLI